MEGENAWTFRATGVRPKIAPKFPDFFVIGAPKCGTTSLFEWLSRHPSLHLPVKEPVYFSQEIQPRGMDLSGYLRIFAHAKSSQLVGDSTALNLYSALGLRSIARFNPAARLIVLLRPPLDLVVSWHGELLREGRESEKSFERAWQLAPLRREGHNVPRLCNGPRLLDYPMWLELGTRLQDVYTLFPNENVMVLLLEDLRDHPREVYSEVLEFLRVPDDDFADFTNARPGWQLRHARIHYAANSVRQWLEPVLRRLHHIAGRDDFGVARWIDRVNQNRDAKPVFSRALFRELMETSRPQIELLERLTGRDLSRWKLEETYAERYMLT